MYIYICIMKSSQLVFVCSFVINKRITLLFSLLDLGMNVTRKDISLTHLAYVMLHAQTERNDCLCNALRRLSSHAALVCVCVCVCVSVNRSVVRQLHYVHNSLPIFTIFCVRLGNMAGSTLIVLEINPK